MSTISKSHEINGEAKIILEGVLSLKNNFILRPLIPDYHVDYLVELVEDKSPSGILFGIQLKGIEKLKAKNNIIKYSIKSKHLSYYLDNVKSIPIYLVIIDITNNIAYWLFIQNYLNELIKNRSWRRQKNVTVYLKTENSLDDIDKFRHSIVKANNYMKELWPSSIPASIKKQKELFSQLDKRFKIESISEEEGNIKYSFKQIKPAKVGFIFKENSKEKFEKYLNDFSEEKITFNRDEVDVTGSDLLKNIFNISKKIEFNIKYPVPNVDVFLLVENNNSLFSDTLHLNGKLSYHKSYFKLDCTQNSLPLKILVIINANTSKKQKLNFKFDFKNWVNKPIQFLPYQEKLYDFFEKFKNGKKLVMRVEYLGKIILDTVLNLNKNDDFIEFINKYFSLCNKLKIVDSYYNLNLLFPGFPKIKWEEKTDIEMLYDLITSNEHVEKHKKFTVNLEVSNEERIYESYSKGAAIRIVSDFKINFLQREIIIKRLAVDIANPKFLISNEKMIELINSNKEFIPLKITTDKKSIITYRLLKDEK